MNSNDNYIAAKLENAGVEMGQKMLEFLRNTGISDSCYAYKLRVKSEAKLLEKKAIKKLIKDKADYDLHKITDVVGLRLVTLFKSDMVDLFNEVVSAISHKNDVKPNPFSADSLEEIIVYIGTTMLDELPLQIKESAKELCPNVEVSVVNSKEGYSSIHIVSRLNKAVNCDTLPTGYFLPIEIQIRTVFEDAWGEIDHKYGYVIRTGKDVGTPINNPDYVLAHLKVLKRFADACMEYADCIREEAAGSTQPSSSTSKVVSVDADDELLERLKCLGVSPNYLDGYEKARQLKLSAMRIRRDNRKQSDQLYLDAAERFRRAC